MTSICYECDEREPVHPVDPLCKSCGGRGHVTAGDAWRSCPTCRFNLRPRWVQKALDSTLPVKEF